MNPVVDDDLMTAACNGDARAVSWALAAGANVNASYSDGTTSLITAAQNGCSAIVKTLLAAGANADATFKDGRTALMFAARSGHLAGVKMLLTAGASVNFVDSKGNSALIWAAYGGHEYVAHLLVEAGADPRICNKMGQSADLIFHGRGLEETAQFLRYGKNSPEAFVSAVERGQLDDVQRLVNSEYVSFRGDHARTPLHFAAQHGRVAIIQILLEHGAKLVTRDDSGSTPLHMACAAGATDAIALLLDKGANGAIVDDCGLSCVDVAALHGHVDAVRMLVDRGATLTNVAVDGRTVLHCGVQSRNPPLVEYLLAQGAAKVNAVDARGCSSLHYATRPQEKSQEIEVFGTPRMAVSNEADKGRLAVLRLLLAVEGVNVDAQDAKGETALLKASATGDVEAVRMLLDHGARTDVADAAGRTPLSVAMAPDLHAVVQLYHNSQQFHDKCFAFINNAGSPPTRGQLMELVPLITAVYDLRLIMTLVSLCDDPMHVAPAIKVACAHVVANKLTFDDAACVFFKLVLERCERDGLLPREDFLLLDRQAEKANTESADWVVEMKKQVHANSWRLDTHEQHLRAVVDGVKHVHAMVMENRAAIVATAGRVEHLQVQVTAGRKLLAQVQSTVSHVSQNMSSLESRLAQSEANIHQVATSLQNFKEAYVTRLQQQERNEKIKKVCGVVAAVAGFVFAPVLQEVAGAVVDFVSPIDIVAKVFGETDIVKFLSEKSAEALPELIQSQLERCAIPQDDFEDLLREEIVLQHPEYLDECARRGLSVNIDGGQSDVARAVAPTLEIEEGALLMLVGELQAALSDATTQSNHSTAAPPRLPVIAPARSFSGPETAFAPSGPPPSQSARPASPSRRPEPVGEQQEEAKAPATSFSAPASNTSDAPTVAFADDLEVFHYHMAVHECGGDFNAFMELMELTDASSCDPTTPMAMELRGVSKSREALCAAEYAYRLGFQAVGDLLASRMTNPRVFDTTRASSVELSVDPEDFPLFYAVVESQGDVEECEHYLELVDGEALDATIEADVVRVINQKVQWTAVEYACHLGYVDVVKYLVKDVYKDRLSMKAKFQMLKTVRERSVRGASLA